MDNIYQCDRNNLLQLSQKLITVYYVNFIL